MEQQRIIEEQKHQFNNVFDFVLGIRAWRPGHARIEGLPRFLQYGAKSGSGVPTISEVLPPAYERVSGVVRLSNMHGRTALLQFEGAITPSLIGPYKELRAQSEIEAIMAVLASDLIILHPSMHFSWIKSLPKVEETVHVPVQHWLEFDAEVAVFVYRGNLPFEGVGLPGQDIIMRTDQMANPVKRHIVVQEADGTIVPYGDEQELRSL